MATIDRKVVAALAKMRCRDVYAQCHENGIAWEAEMGSLWARFGSWDADAPKYRLQIQPLVKIMVASKGDATFAIGERHAMVNVGNFAANLLFERCDSTEKMAGGGDAIVELPANTLHEALAGVWPVVDAGERGSEYLTVLIRCRGTLDVMAVTPSAVCCIDSEIEVAGDAIIELQAEVVKPLMAVIGNGLDAVKVSRQGNQVTFARSDALATTVESSIHRTRQIDEVLAVEGSRAEVDAKELVKAVRAARVVSPNVKLTFDGNECSVKAWDGDEDVMRTITVAGTPECSEMVMASWYLLAALHPMEGKVLISAKQERPVVLTQGAVRAVVMPMRG